MKTKQTLRIGIVLAGLVMLLQSPSALLAQSEDSGREQDPPSRVARLNHADGSVSFQPGGEGDWVQAVPNRPLTTGDNLWADQGSRAELHMGSTALRIGQETSLTFLDLDDQNTQLKLSQGSLIVRVRHLDDGDNFEIDTPNLAFLVQRTGEYRIDVNADGNETDTTVWHGRAEVTGGGDTYTVVGGQYARFAGNDQLDHEIQQIPGSDDLANWAFSRDQREDHSESANYISTEMTGYEDLDEYGSWHYVAEYGPVWSPRGIDNDWAPYRHGHWAWVDPWGWTWVEDEPWGFAPFHYGRWAYVSNSWCWVPGPVVVRPVYAPALVAFVGGGGGFRVAVGFGGGEGVGWFPLGPREVYVPWYRTSPRYVNNVNVTNTRVSVTQVTNVYNTYNNNTTNVSRVTYVNQHVNNAVTVVSHDTFVNARPVHQNIVRVDQRQMEQAQVVRAAPMQPVRASVIGAGAPSRMAPPAAVANRQVVGTRMPTAPRASFEQRQTANIRTERPTTAQPINQAPHQGRTFQQPQQSQSRTNSQPGQPPQGMNERNVQQPNVPQPNQPRPQQPAARVKDIPRPQNQGNGQNQPPVNERNVQQPNHQQPAARINEIPRPQPQGNQGINERNVPRPQAQADNVRQQNQQQQQQQQQQQLQQQQRQQYQQQQSRQQENQNVRVPQPEHPLVRQAPPAQERPEQQRSEEQKFSNWHQQREVAQPQAPRPQERQAAPPPAPREAPAPKTQERAPQPPPRNEKPKQ